MGILRLNAERIQGNWRTRGIGESRGRWVWSPGEVSKRQVKYWYGVGQLFGVLGVGEGRRKMAWGRVGLGWLPKGGVALNGECP
ncbi:hypothetical protein Scani_05100 [Streptomyces caniferus]|uniref:Uncharacterized protein n=1 Tax=Streptomyces caniferus TaxID=285557 RepID=A0A640S0Q7_9ACTN|nr:hypothetical protein Scani_05100 [Streptomyces caniferus]